MMRRYLRAVIFSLLACVLNATNWIQENRQELSKIYLTAVNWTAQQLAAIHYVLDDRAIATKAISALAQVLPPEAHATRDFLEGVADERESDFYDKVKAHFEKGSKKISHPIKGLIVLSKHWKEFFEKIEKNPDSLIDELTFTFAAHSKILAKYLKSSLSTSTSTSSPEALTAMSIFRIGHGLPVVREETTEEEFKQKASEMQSFYDQANLTIATAWASRLPVNRQIAIFKEMKIATEYANASERYNAYASLSDDAITYLARRNGLHVDDFRFALCESASSFRFLSGEAKEMMGMNRHRVFSLPGIAYAAFWSANELPRKQRQFSSRRQGSGQGATGAESSRRQGSGQGATGAESRRQGSGQGATGAESSRRQGSGQGATGADVGWAEWFTGLFKKSTHNGSSRSSSQDSAEEGSSVDPPSRLRSGCRRRRTTTTLIDE